MNITDLYSKDTNMKLVLDKCRTLSIRNGKVILNGYETIDWGTSRSMDEIET